MDHRLQQSGACTRPFSLCCLARGLVRACSSYAFKPIRCAALAALHSTPVAIQPTLSLERPGCPDRPPVWQALYAGQELYLLPYASLDERRALCPYEYLEGLVKTVAELRRCDVGDAAEWVASHEEEEIPTWRTFEMLQEMRCNTILVDKTPQYVDHPSYLDHAHAIFGRSARYVHLVRHPYACIESGVELMVKYVRHDAVNTERGGDPSLAWPIMESGWVAAQTNANEFLVRICQDLLTDDARPWAQRILYEDLLREPTRVLAEICQLLDVTFDPNMVEPYDTEAVQTFRSAQSLSITDPKLLRRKHIEAAQADKWRMVKLPQPLSEVAKLLAQGFGYSLKGNED